MGVHETVSGLEHLVNYQHLG